MIGDGKPSRWRLNSITIRDFRGVSGTCSMKFGSSSALIHGDNGVGKSTIALAMQWTLFGVFPKGVLGAPNDKFMGPVGGESKSWFGQVEFSRDGKGLEITRDQKEERFSLKFDGKTYEDEKAERQRDLLLGLDMDTFIRAVLLQQSRIRGLLLDEPKERNKALDRLLGMEDVEVFLLFLKKKEFEEAANAWRWHIQAIESHYASQQELLEEKLKEVEDEARKAKFQSKYMSLAGLRLAYSELGSELNKIAIKYGVQVDSFPQADSLAAAQKVSRMLGKSLKEIRVSSELQKRLVPVQKKLASVESIYEQWTEIIEEREELKTERDALVREHGDLAAIGKKMADLDRDISIQEKKLKEANQLRQLLVEALEYVTARPEDKCPVCDQQLPASHKLVSDLKRRIGGLANQAVLQAEERLKTLIENKGNIVETQEELKAAEDSLKKAQKNVDAMRKNIKELLGIPGLKIEAELQKEIAKLESEKTDIERGVHAMEQDLGALVERDQDIKDILVPLIGVREDLARHEKDWQNAKKKYSEHEKRAAAMDNLATNIERIQKALLEAKNEIASEFLGKAGPRAQELYTTLVRHQLFDILKVKTSPQARKVDYSFEVSSSELSKSSREARLVLSDGQLTAAALALFFALAETSAHGLDFLYVDDPTQNLDHARKEAMARVIFELAKRKQVIVSTQDEDFVTLLDDVGYGSNAIVHHIESWKRTPEITTTVPNGHI